MNNLIYMDDEPAYVSDISQADRQIFDQLTQNRHWDSSDFSQALYISSITSSYFPAPNRPDSIHIQTLRLPLEELKARINEDGKEHNS